jgi:outer membrane lipoprotein LolB
VSRGATTPRDLPLWRRAGMVAATLLIAAGCATVPAPAPNGDSLSGRLTLRVDDFGMQPPRTLSAAFDLRGDARAGTFGLSTPLGTMLALARWSPNEVVLSTPQGERAFASLAELTREAVGESVPIEAWFDWLRGRPWPGAPSTATAPDAAARTSIGPAGFSQLGWGVDLSRFHEGVVIATRSEPPPTVSARIHLDQAAP